MNVAQSRGGVEACLEDDNALKALDAISKKRSSESSLSGNQGACSKEKRHTAETSFTSLKKDLKENIDEALEKNMLIFEKKLEFQKRQITAEMAEVVTRESDRVISAVISGPHDRIKDSVGLILPTCAIYVDDIRTCIRYGWKWFGFLICV